MTSEADNNDGFLSRWSRRKLDDDTADNKNEPENSSDSHPEPEQSTSDQTSLPVWQQKDADPDIKKQALTALFSQAEFNERDGLNEYDEDYTTFSSLGDVVTQEMKRMLRLAEQKTRPDERSQTSNELASSIDQQTDVDIEQDNNEDNERA